MTTSSPVSPATTPVRAHTWSLSRLLWPMYLFFVAWIVLPVYATIVAGLLPLGDADVDRLLRIAIVGCGLFAWWSGIRGGPLLMSEAQVLLGLSGRTALPARVAVVRQAVFVSGFFGLGAAWLTAMAERGNFDWALSTQRTLVGMSVGIAIVSLAVLWNLDGLQWLDRGTALVISVLLAMVGLTAPTPEDAVGWLLLLAVAALALAAMRSADIRLDQMWSRSLVLAELLYGAALLDYRSALASLRASRDGPRVARGKPGVGKMPVWLWRPIRSLSGAPAIVLVRLVTMVGGVVVSLAVLQDTAARLAAVAGVLAVGAVDLTAPLAAVVRSPLMHRSSRVPARLTLVTEGAIAVLATVAIGMAGFAIVYRLPGELHTPEVLAVAVAAGASSMVQARLGSPDLAAMIDRYGAERLHGSLAMRSAMPVLALFLTVSAVISLTNHWNPTLAMFVVAAWFIVLTMTTSPKAEE
ncbi:MAG: hypothetical protein WAL25_07720 [Acidimicrobiia bacterium]